MTNPRWSEAVTSIARTINNTIKYIFNTLSFRSSLELHNYLQSLHFMVYTVLNPTLTGYIRCYPLVLTSFLLCQGSVALKDFHYLTSWPLRWRMKAFNCPVQHSPSLLHVATESLGGSKCATISSCACELTWKWLLSISLLECPSVYQSFLWT